MLYSTTALLALLSATTTSAAPTTASTSKGVKLVASGYPATDGQTYYLSYQRVSQGVNIATVVAGCEHGAVFWVDNTYKTQVKTDIPGVYPLGITLQPRDQFDPEYPEDHDVSINVNNAAWLDIQDKLSGPYAPPNPDPDAEYMVCDRAYYLGGNAVTQLKAVRIKYTGESVPEGCSVVQFKPECAVLEDLPAGSSWNHDKAVDLTCSTF